MSCCHIPPHRWLKNPSLLNHNRFESIKWILLFKMFHFRVFSTSLLLLLCPSTIYNASFNLDITYWGSYHQSVGALYSWKTSTPGPILFLDFSALAESVANRPLTNASSHGYFIRGTQSARYSPVLPELYPICFSI